MHIGLLSAASSVHTVRIANGLEKLGHKVTLFSLPDHREQDGAFSPKVELKYLKYGGGRGYIVNICDFKKKLSASGIDILHAHFASGYGTLASLAGFRPYILSVWGTDIYEFPEKSPVHRWLIKRNLEKADAIFSTSQVMAERTKRYVKDRPIIITPFGINADIFSPAEKKNTGSINIGIVKLIAPRYGIKELIQAFAELVASMPGKGLSMSIYGDGTQLSEMKELVKTFGISEKVKFFGRIPHSKVPDALRSMDIFCAPSIYESFGVSVVEAMACGVPCVTSDADGFKEVMEDGITGFIVPKKDVGALAEKLAVLVNDKDLRDRMGEAGRKRAVELYNWQDNIGNISESLIHWRAIHERKMGKA